MTPEQKVTSFELSRKLKEAGAEQESEWSWYDPGDGAFLLSNDDDEGGLTGEIGEEWTYSAFTCAELLEGLPYQMVWNEDGEKVSQRLRSTWRGDGVTVGYRGLCQAFDEQFVEALGKLELWRLENGHIKEGRI